MYHLEGIEVPSTERKLPIIIDIPEGFGIVPMLYRSAKKDLGGYYKEVHVIENKICGEVGRKNYCKSCGREVGKEEVDRAFQLGRDNLILLSEDERKDIEELRLADAGFRLAGYMKRFYIDPMFFENFLILEPDKFGERFYAFISSFIEKEDSYFIVEGKTTRTGRWRRGLMDVYSDVLRINLLSFPDQVIRLKEIIEGLRMRLYSPREEEVAQFITRVKQLHRGFTPEEFVSGYRELRDKEEKLLFEIMEPKLLGKPLALPEIKPVTELPEEYKRELGLIVVTERELPEKLEGASERYKNIFSHVKESEGKYSGGVPEEVILKESGIPERAVRSALKGLVEEYKVLVEEHTPTGKVYKSLD